MTAPIATTMSAIPTSGLASLARAVTVSDVSGVDMATTCLQARSFATSAADSTRPRDLNSPSILRAGGVENSKIKQTK